MLVERGMALLGLIVPLTTLDANVLWMSWLVDCVTTSDGGKFDPPPLLKLIASPGATSPIRTPTAPALAAASIFRLTEHAPRSISAIAPFGLARYWSAGLPVEIEPAGQPRPT